MKTISQILVLMTLSMTITSPGFAARGQLNSCQALLAGETLPTLRLFGDDPVLDSVKVSSTSSIPYGNELESKFLTSFSQRGLRNVIRSEGGALKLINTLVRIGLLKKEVSSGANEPQYPALVLAANNKSVNLDETHPDPVVNKYLITKRLYARVRLQKLSAIIPAEPEAKRDQYLYWQILKALNQIRDDDTESRNAINACFTEMGRLQTYLHDNIITDPLIADKITDRILNGLQAQATYIPKKIELYDSVTDAIEAIPILNLGPMISALTDFFNRLVLKNRLVMTQILNPGEDHFRLEQVEGTYRVGFVERDPFLIGENAKIFLAKYMDMNQKVNLFSEEFANDFELAYPELTSIRYTAGLEQNTVGIQSVYFDKGPFGPGNYEGYKVMNRMALTIGLVRGDASVFPKLSSEEFQRFRSNFLSDLKISDGANLSAEALDRFNVFLILDTLGRGRSDFLDELARIYDLKKVGVDYERKSAAIISTYHYAAHSFARLDDASQEIVLKWFNNIYRNSIGQVIQLQSNSFAYLSDVDLASLAVLEMRSLLSFAALPSSLGAQVGSHTLDSANFAQWEAFRDISFLIATHDKNPKDAFHDYLTWTAGILGLSADLTKVENVVTIELATQAHASTPTVARQISEEYAMLSPDEKSTMDRFMVEIPMSSFGNSALFGVIAGKNASAHFTDHPYLLAMKVLTKAYSTLLSLNTFKDDVRKAPNSEKKINIRYLVDAAATSSNPSVLLNAKFMAVRLADSYEVRIIP